MDVWQETPPDRDGWWKFREHGMEHIEQTILVIDGWVADDSDWEAATGEAPDLTFSENYWEGNPVCELTDGTLTSGVWSFVRDPGIARGG